MEWIKCCHYIKYLRCKTLLILCSHMEGERAKLFSFPHRTELSSFQWWITYQQKIIMAINSHVCLNFQQFLKTNLAPLINLKSETWLFKLTNYGCFFIVLAFKTGFHLFQKSPSDHSLFRCSLLTCILCSVLLCTEEQLSK